MVQKGLYDGVQCPINLQSEKKRKVEYSKKIDYLKSVIEEHPNEKGIDVRLRLPV